MNKFIFPLICIASCSLLSAAEVSHTSQSIDPTRTALTITIDLQPQELVYKDFLTYTVDHPDVEIISVDIKPSPETAYIPDFHANKEVYNENITLVIHTKATQQPVSDAHIIVSYLSSAQKKIEEVIIPIPFSSAKAEQKPEPVITDIPESKKTILSSSMNTISTWSRNLERLIQTTQLWWVRFLLIILLGLLMSLTPCIYPMLPITLGIMQSQGNKSLFLNFLHASFYALGIALTFAFMGLLAVTTGTIFGSLLTNPLVVLTIVAVLTYLAGSMFGFYEMYIPNFMQDHGQRKHQGSILSSFMFGAMSGTIASPCLSPGLALVLSIVATLGSKLLGFLLLFAFGIGLSIPLLILGTFSSSLNLLPRAGSWMMEIKKVFGFLLVGMSFYYLSNILPYHIILWKAAFFCAAAGIYNFYSIAKYDKPIWKRIKNIFGTLFLIGAVLLSVQAYQYTFQAIPAEVDTFWYTDYKTASEVAIQNKQLMFIDFWAPSCSICTAIEKKLLKDPTVRKTLQKCIPVKLELNLNDPVIAQLKKDFSILGLPTLIAYNPIEHTIVQRWGAELYETDKATFIKQIEEL